MALPLLSLNVITLEEDRVLSARTARYENLIDTISSWKNGYLFRVQTFPRQVSYFNDVVSVKNFSDRSKKFSLLVLYDSSIVEAVATFSKTNSGGEVVLYPHESSSVNLKVVSKIDYYKPAYIFLYFVPEEI